MEDRSTEALATLRRRYRRYEWRADTVGMSGAGVFALDGPARLYVKVSPVGSPDPAKQPLREAECLAWLAARGVPAAAIVEAGTVDDCDFLVTEAIDGRPACEPWGTAERDRVVDVLADFAAGLHRLDVEGCPFDRRLRVRMPAAQEAAGVGDVDPADLSAPWTGWTIGRIVTELLALARIVGREDPVVTHGDYCLPNVLVDAAATRVVGVVDVGRMGVADRYADLALMAFSMGRPDLNAQFDPGHADRFLARYGAAPVDRDRMGLYRLLDAFA